MHFGAFGFLRSILIVHSRLLSVDAAPKQFWPSESGEHDKLARLTLHKFVQAMQHALEKHQQKNPHLVMKKIILPKHTPSRAPSGGSVEGSNQDAQKPKASKAAGRKKR